MNSRLVAGGSVSGQMMRFGLVGLLLWWLDAAVLALAVDLGANPYTGRAASLAASVLAGFLLNRRFTFRAAGQPTFAEARRYVAAAALGIAANYLVFAGLVALGAGHAPAIAAGMGAAALVTFIRFRGIFAGR